MERNSGKRSSNQECHQWKAIGLCSKGDSCSFSHDPECGNRCDQRQKGQSSSPAPKAKARTDGKIHSKSSGRRGESPSRKGGKVPTSHINTYHNINTYQHAQQHCTDTPHHQAHFSFQHRYRPTSFHVARGLHRKNLINVSCMMGTCSPDKEWTTVRAPWASSQVRAVCTERANCRSAHCHCYWKSCSHTTHTT